MRGIVHVGEGVVEITDALEVRDPAPNQVKVRLVNAGVCHSDLSFVNGFLVSASAALRICLYSRSISRESQPGPSGISRSSIDRVTSSTRSTYRAKRSLSANTRCIRRFRREPP